MFTLVYVTNDALLQLYKKGMEIQWDLSILNRDIIGMEF